MGRIFLSLFFLLLSSSLWSQETTCPACHDCGRVIEDGEDGIQAFADTINKPYISVQDFHLNVFNIRPNNLSNQDNCIKKVNIHFRHDLVGDVEMFLIAPDGDEIQLIGPISVGFSSTENTNFKISFIPRKDISMPDDGLEQTWDNNQEWAFFGTRNGQYYPHLGDLSDLSGQVNGSWTLRVLDGNPEGNDTGRLIDFDIEFCEEEGLECDPCKDETAEGVPCIFELEGSIEEITPIETPCIDVMAQNMAFLKEMHWEMAWDPTIIKYRTVQNIDNVALPDFRISDFRITNQTIQFDYVIPADDTLGIVVADSTVLFQVCFEALGEEGDSSLFNFNNIAVTQLDNVMMGTDSEPGKVLIAVDLSADCGTAKQLCDKTPIAVSKTKGPGLFKEEGDAGSCWGEAAETQSKWYTFDILSSGTLEFAIIPNGNAGYRYNLLQGACESSAVECFSGGNNTDRAIGLSDNGVDSFSVAGKFDPARNVTVGEKYFLVVDNQDNNEVGFELQFAGSALIGDATLIVAIETPSVLNCTADTLFLNTATTSTGDQYNYVWDTRGVAFKNEVDILTPLVDKAGTYTLTVEDTNTKCRVEQSVEVTDDFSFPIAKITKDQDTLNCINPILELDGSSSSQGAEFIYDWSGTVFNKPSPTNAEIDRAGTYILSVINETNSCVSKDTIRIISDFLEPDLQVNDDLISCKTPSLNALALSQTPSAIISWSGAPLSAPITTRELTITEPGLYMVTAIAANGCTTIDTVNITDERVFPEAIAGETTLLTCQLPIFELKGEASSSGPEFIYDWQTSDGRFLEGTDLASANPAIDRSGTYVLEISNTINGCSVKDSVTITQIFELPVVDIASDSILTCDQPSIQLDASSSDAGPNFMIDWQANNGGNISTGMDSYQPEINKGGTFVLTITNTSTGCSEKDSVRITESMDRPNIMTTGNTISCNARQVNISALSDTLGVLMTWSSDVLPNELTGEQIQVRIPGNYEVEALAPNGCTNSALVIVVDSLQTPDLEIPVDTTLTCSVSGINLTATTSIANSQFLWITPDRDTIRSSEHLAEKIGIYTHTVIGPNGCPSTKSLEVKIDENVPVVNLAVPAELTCNTPISNLSAAGSSEGNTFSYTWSTTNGQYESSSNLDSLQVQVITQGTYIFSVYDSSNDCETIDSITVEDIRKFPIVNFNIPMFDTLSCVKQSIPVFGTTDLVGERAYSWQKNDVLLSETEDLVITDPGIYSLEITDLSNNCPTTEIVTIAIDTMLPTAEAGPSQILNCAVNNLQLDGRGSSEGDDFSYIWTHNASSIGEGMQINVTEPGIYYLAVINEKTICIATDSVVINASLDTPIADAGTDTLYCVGILDLELLLGTDATSFGPEYLYEWTDSNRTIVGTERMLKVFTGGDFYLKVTNTNNQCVENDSIQITERPRPNVSIEETGAINCMENSIQFTAKSDLPNVTIEWIGPESFNFPTLTATDELEGAGYIAQVTENETGCIGSSGQITISADRNPPFVQPGFSTFINCQDTVLLDGSGSREDSIFSYKWSTVDGNIINDSTKITAMADAPGLYQLEITNTKNKCKNTDTVRITDNQIIPIIELGLDKTINCREESFDLRSDNLLTNSFTFHFWTDESGQTIGTNPRLQGINTVGTYQLMVVDSSNNCSAIDSIKILEDTKSPVVNVLDSLIIDCTMPSTTIEATSDIVGVYSWESSNGQFLSGANTLNPIVNAAGEYILKVENTANGCSSLDTVKVIDKQNKPDIDLMDNATIFCYNDSTATIFGMLNSDNSAIELEWTSTVPSFQTITDTLNLLVDQPGTYYLSATDTETSCFSIDSVVVTDNRTSFDFTLPTDILTLTCSEPELPIGTNTLPVSGELAYTWNTVDGNITGPKNSSVTLVNTAGVYTLEVLNVENGCTSFDEVTILAGDDLPIVDAGISQTITCGNPMVQLGSNNTDQGPQFQYVWSTRDGRIVSGRDDLFATVNEAGTYQLVVTNTDNDCKQSSMVAITAQTMIEDLTLPESRFIDCKDSLINLTVETIADPALTYNWTTTTGNILSPTNNPEITINRPGIYRIEINNRDTECNLIDSVRIQSLQEMPIAMAGEDVLIPCNENNTILSTNGSSTGNNINYEWLNEQGNLVSRNNNITINAPGNYTLKVNNQDNGCTSEDQVLVAIPTDFPNNADLAIQEIACQGSEDAAITINEIVGGLAPYILRVNGTAISVGESINNLAAGNYQLSVLDANACEWDSTIIIEIPEAIDLQIISSNNSLTTGDIVDLSIAGNVPLEQIADLNWGPEQLFDCSDCPTQSIALFNTTPITLSIIDENGCEGSTTVNIEVALAELPNAITINGDGVNDTFIVPILEAEPDEHPDNEMIIFNRWGDVVHRASPYNNDWDGSSNGQLLPEGTYYYVLRLDVSEGSGIKGKITILR